MSLRKMVLALAVAGLAIVASPSRASADWLFTPFVGGNFGGNANFGNFNTVDDEVERRVNMGASIGWMGKGIAGFEVDFGFAPNFFQDTNGDADFAFGDSNVTTLMANLVVGAPFGGTTGKGFRPYGTAGVGMIRSRIDSGTSLFNDLNTNDLGINVGAGVQGFFNDHVGMRGDVRYMRSLQDNNPTSDLDLGLSNFDFWRATVGVTFRFGN
jgi:opacity protein-like surface antigen